MKGSLLLGFLFLLLFHVLLGVLEKEKFLFGLHLASDVAAIESAVPFFLVFLRVKAKIDVKALLILLYGEDDEDVRLRMIVYVFNFMQLDGTNATRLMHTQLI